MQDPIADEIESQRLHFAAMKGDIAALESYLVAGDPIDQFDEMGKTALHHATESNHLEAARFLLGRGANVNAINQNI